jgi:DNA-binding transcriptional LysR family regulator
MIDELRALAVFAKTVECGSFRGAARALGLSPSVISHHIAGLEQRLGTALLYRSTRRLSLTAKGAVLYSSAVRMLEAATHGLNAIALQSNEPSGKLTLTIPAFFTRSSLLTEIAEFAIAFPKLEIDISFSDEAKDLIRDGIDMAIRVGDLKDSSLKSKKIFEFRRKLVVSPAYLGTRNAASRPSDLLDWDWVGFKLRPNYKTLVHENLAPVRIDYIPRVVVDNVDAAWQFALAGAGLATPAFFSVERELASGLLVEPLPEWEATPLSVYALWPANASKSSLSLRFLDFLIERRKLKQLFE